MMLLYQKIRKAYVFSNIWKLHRHAPLLERLFTCFKKEILDLPLLKSCHIINQFLWLRKIDKLINKDFLQRRSMYSMKYNICTEHE